VQDSNAQRQAGEILRHALELGITLEPLDGHRLSYDCLAAAIRELQGAVARYKIEIHRPIVADRRANAVPPDLANRDGIDLVYYSALSCVNNGAQGKDDDTEHPKRYAAYSPCSRPSLRLLLAYIAISFNRAQEGQANRNERCPNWRKEKHVPTHTAGSAARLPCPKSTRRARAHLAVVGCGPFKRLWAILENGESVCGETNNALLATLSSLNSPLIRATK
jgi:hypothetical protein